MSFCSYCSKCPQCCHRDQCRGKASEILASLAEIGCESQSGVHLERRLFSALLRKATTQQVSLDCKQVRKPAQKQISHRSFGFLSSKTGCRESGCQVLTSLLQPALSGPKTQQKMATNRGSQPVKSVSRNKDIQNGDSRDHKTLPPQRRMGYFAGLQRCIFPHSNKSQVQEISKVSPKQVNSPVHCSSLWIGNSPIGIH